jgi:hypothetical protein
MAGNGENKGWPKHNRFIPDGRFIKICLSNKCRKIYPKHCKACMYCGYLGFGIRAVIEDAKIEANILSLQLNSEAIANEYKLDIKLTDNISYDLEEALIGINILKDPTP